MIKKVFCEGAGKLERTSVGIECSWPLCGEAALDEVP